jgi:hypothetical protein
MTKDSIDQIVKIGASGSDDIKLHTIGAYEEGGIKQWLLP